MTRPQKMLSVQTPVQLLWKPVDAAVMRGVCYATKCFSRRTLGMVGICLSIFAGQSKELLAVNILLNPSFELGSGADAADWDEFGGPAGSTSRSDSMPNSGSFHVYMEVDHINNTPAATPYFIQQVQPVGSIDNTLNYDLSFSAKVDSLNFEGIDIFYQLQWLDQDASNGGGVKGEVLVSMIPAGINTNYQVFGLSNIDVPDGADSFLLRFQLSPGPIEGILNGFYVDDASLSVNGAVTQLSGDYNLSNAVDIADYTVWRDNLGAPEGTLPNDPNSGPIGIAQYNTWKDNFGANLSPPNTAANATVPEPSTIFLCSMGMILLFSMTRTSAASACGMR